MKAILLFATLLLAGPVTPVRAEAPSNATKKEVTKTYKQIAAAIRRSDFDAATQLMTESTAEQFIADNLMMALEVGESGGDGIARRFKAITKKFGLTSQVIPSELYSQDQIDMKGYEKLIQRAHKNILNKLGTRPRQLEALAAIFKVNASLSENEVYDFGLMNPFAGSVSKITGTDQAAVVHSEGEFEPNFLNFQKTSDGWRWSGHNEDLYFDWMDKPRELIQNITLSGKTFDGKLVELSRMKGKVVLIDFWGTWCGPCVAELPTLKKIYTALNKKGFEIIGVAQDDPETLKHFFKKRELPWPSIVDRDGRIARKFNVNAFPTLLLVDQQGNHFASDLFGPELVDQLVNQLQLDPAEFGSLKESLRESDKEWIHEENDLLQTNDMPSNGQLPIGFSAADHNGDEKVDANEMREYLVARVPEELPYQKIFARMDLDRNATLSEEEFATRHDAISHFMGEGFFGGMPEPEDPGTDFVLVPDLRSPLDDRKIIGAVYHRYYELLASRNAWPTITLNKVPQKAKASAGLGSVGTSSGIGTKTSTLMNVYKATAVIAGGGDEFFTAGAVLVSPDGLAITNYHVAEAISDSPLVCLLHNGKAHAVAEFLAGNKERDVALIRLEGENFPFVKVAKEMPNIGSDLHMVHHSENRFFTYDRGYVMRYPVVGQYPWMEISMDYAPGGSGCGIFNEQLELVGIVSTIQFGDGPSLAEPFTDFEESPNSAMEDDEAAPSFHEEALIMVKHAVSLNSIQSLWK